MTFAGARAYVCDGRGHEHRAHQMHRTYCASDGHGTARASVCLHPLAGDSMEGSSRRRRRRTHGRHMSGQDRECPRRRPISASSSNHWLEGSANGARPPPGRRPMGCAQNVGTWIPAHVDARKVAREKSSPRHGPMIRATGCES